MPGPITLATWITIARLVIVAPMLLMVHVEPPRYYVPLLWLLWVALLSDALDGYIARTLNQKSVLGGLLDSLTDKILVFGMLFSFYGLGVLSPWLVFPIFALDSLVDGFRNFGTQSARAKKPTAWGRVKSALQFLSINAAIFCFLVSDPDSFAVATAANWLLGGALAVSVLGFLTLFDDHTDTGSGA